jgi:hypothetical protein
MSLINEGDSFPSQLWSVVRLLQSVPGKLDVGTARRILTPDTLPTGDKENEDFKVAVGTLTDLGLVTIVGDAIELTPTARALSPDNVAGFNGLLREAALDQSRNARLADKTPTGEPDLSGPKDLVRALAWFLTLDPFKPLDWDAVQGPQATAFAPHLPEPLANDVRWNRFTYWGPALGFVARPLLPPKGAVRLVPDCTVAVRDTVLALWKEDEQVDAAEAVTRITDRLPVLPGGVYSRSLGLEGPAGTVSASLSNALLTGEEQGWLTFGRLADAADDILLTDVGGTRRVTQFTITRSA